MTDKPPPDARAFDRVQQQLAEAEAEELGAIPVEQLHEELRRAKLEPGAGLDAVAAARAKVDAESAARAQAQESKPGNVVDMAAARKRRGIAPVTYVLAVAAAAALVVGLAERQEIVAWMSPAPPPVPTLTPTPVPTAPPPPTELQLAATLRDRAYDDCKKGYMVECTDKVEAAHALDLDYAGDPRWNETTVAVNDWKLGLAARREALAKPHLGPGERPLKERHVH